MHRPPGRTVDGRPGFGAKKRRQFTFDQMPERGGQTRSDTLPLLRVEQFVAACLDRRTQNVATRPEPCDHRLLPVNLACSVIEPERSVGSITARRDTKRDFRPHGAAGRAGQSDTIGLRQSRIHMQCKTLHPPDRMAFDNHFAIMLYRG